MPTRRGLLRSRVTRSRLHSRSCTGWYPGRSAPVNMRNHPIARELIAELTQRAPRRLREVVAC
ncbi:MAG TPA: hypothetical protein VFQ77_04845 [Pseudonocardiaceae bacterium]|nr:hypothetical protein [Pseudonocardiaceae bacterium]